MDKTGVCPGEGEAPKPGEKAAQDATKVGGDLLSRMSEEAVPGGITRAACDDAVKATQAKQ